MIRVTQVAARDAARDAARLSKNCERAETTATFVDVCSVLRVAKDVVPRANNLGETESYS